MRVPGPGLGELSRPGLGALFRAGLGALFSTGLGALPSGRGWPRESFSRRLPSWVLAMTTQA